MNITLTNSSYVCFRSVQLILSFWHDFSIFQSDDLWDICHFILARLQCEHWTVLDSWSFISRKLTSSICKLIGPECPILACQSILSSIEAGLESLEVSLLRWSLTAIKMVGELSSISSIIYWRVICLRVATSDESLSLNNILLTVFQWIPLSIRWEIETRLVAKSEQYATFLSLKVLLFFSCRATLLYPRMGMSEISAIR